MDEYTVLDINEHSQLPGPQLGQEELLFNSPVVPSVTVDEVDSSSDSVAAARFGTGRSSLGLPGPPLGAAASLSLEGPGDRLARRFLPRTASVQLMGSCVSSAAGASAGLVPGAPAGEAGDGSAAAERVGASANSDPASCSSPPGARSLMGSGCGWVEPSASPGTASRSSATPLTCSWEEEEATGGAADEVVRALHCEGP